MRVKSYKKKLNQGNILLPNEKSNHNGTETVLFLL